MAAPTLQSRVLYGLKTDVAGNAHYITDSDILYPVGNAVAIHNFSQHHQRLLRLPEKHLINIIAVTPNKKYVAVLETGEKPTITIYDIHTLKKKKSLGIPYDAPGVTKFTCISFTNDSRCLAAVTGDPDQTMLFYAWEKGKVESSIKVGNPQNQLASVECISCNPGDLGVIALGGPGIFKFLTVSESVWRPYGFTKADNIPIGSMAWLNADRLVAGTRDGRILYLENGDLKNIYKVTETISMNLKIREEYVIQGTGSQTGLTGYSGDADTVWEHDVRSLVSFERGFAFGFGPGTIVLFEREGPHKYTKRNVYVVPSQVSKEGGSDRLYRINSVAVNLSCDRLLVTTGWSQLFLAKLWGPDLTADPQPQTLGVAGQRLHYGSIGGLSVCAWKSVVMTWGDLDRSVRIWDYESETLALAKQYHEDIYSVALHPIGLFCLVGFSDKLRFMSILLDDLRMIHEIPIRNCRTVEFSHGGHMFAAVNGNIVQIYGTIGFTSRHLLKGHTGKIRGIVWSRSDTKLVSIGSEGAIYEWDMSSGKRSAEVILKGISPNGVVLTTDGVTVYCVSNDRRIREIRDGTVMHEYGGRETDMEILAIGKDDVAMFVAVPGGVIVSLKVPLQEPLSGVEFHIHCMDVTCMRLSFDEKILISAAADGTLCFWNIIGADGQALAKDATEFRCANEVLIGKGDLDDKVRTIEELTVRIRELETEHAYKARQTEVRHNDKVREIHRGYCAAIEELGEQIDKIQEDRANELNNINAEITKMKAAHAEAMRQMEMNYDAKLITEYEKYRAFEERNNEMRENYERLLAELEKKWATEMERVVREYEARVHSKSLELEEAHEEMAHRVRVDEKLKEQIEDDADREMVDLRTNYEARIHEERRTNLKLKGEAGVLRNKYFATRKETEDLKRQTIGLQGEQVHLQKTIHELEKDIRDLKKEINERDATIREKEKRIYDLKRNNQELEKFKFVLNYKISELKSQAEPRERETKDLKGKIGDMESELINLHRTNVSLETQLRELREKLGASRRENQLEMQRNTRCQLLLTKIRFDLSDAAGLIQEPDALKAAVAKLYRRYSASEQLARGRSADLSAQCEFAKQRDQLERTVSSLRKQIIGDTSGDDGQVEKMLDENVTLIVQLNAFREELKRARKHSADMESLLGLSGRKLRPAEARRKLAEACHGKEELQREYKSQMRECERIVATLQDYIKRLVGEIDASDAAS